MLGRSVSTLACVLGAAESFLLPPNVTPEDARGLAIESFPQQPDQAIVQLPCSECAFSGTQERVEIDEDDEDGLIWIQGGANNVVVNLTISQDGERLEANGETIYPLSFQLEDIFHSPKIYVNEVPSQASVEDIVNGNTRTTPLEVTGHGVAVLGEESITDNGDVLVPIKFNIYELEHQPVSLDEVTIQLLKNQKGGLMLLQAFGTPKTMNLTPFFGPEQSSEESFVPAPPSKDGPPGPPPADFGKHKECKNLPAALCKFKTMVEDKIMGMRKGGCRGRKGGRPHGGKMPGHHRPPPFPRPEDLHADLHEGPPEKPHHHGRPHHMRPHGHHHEHHHKHHFLHAFTRGLAAVLIPTMAGVAVGMTVSLVGLLVGRLIGFLWIKLYRGGRRGYASVALDETTANKFDDVEKEVVDHKKAEEAPPVYERASAYEEAVNETK